MHAAGSIKTVHSPLLREGTSPVRFEKMLIQYPYQTSVTWAEHVTTEDIEKNGRWYPDTQGLHSQGVCREQI